VQRLGEVPVRAQLERALALEGIRLGGHHHQLGAGQVYAPPHPGFGVSDSAEWMESIDDLARFYLWFLDEIGLSY
jgi:hypothetical protein